MKEHSTMNKLNLYTMKQAAAELIMTVAAVAALKNIGILKHEKVGTTIIISGESVAAFKEKHRAEYAAFEALSAEEPVEDEPDGGSDQGSVEPFVED
jgi:hypothetical protein